MKVCSKCKIEKPYTEFYKASKCRINVTDGYRAACKKCTNIENRDSWKKHNVERNQNKAKYRENNRSSIRAKLKKHYEENKGYYFSKDKARKLRLQQSTLGDVPWSSVIKPFRDKAKEMTSKTGIKHVVDHIMPLKGKNSSGLTVPWNLRVIPERFNQVKGNKEVLNG